MSLELKGKVSLDGSGFEAGLKKIEGGAERAAHSLKHLAIEAFGIYGVHAVLQRTVDTAKELVTASERLGVGVEQLQVLKQAAKDSNTELSTVVTAFEKIDIAREKALSGSKEGMKLLSRFSQVGISRGDLQTQTAGQLFMGPLRAATSKMNQEDLGPIFREIMGKGFGEVIPVLKKNFEELEAHMKKLGMIMSIESAVSIKLLGDEFEMLANIIVAQVAPALVWLAERIYRGFGRLASLSASLGAATSNMKPSQVAALISDLINPFGPSPDKILKKLNMPAAAKAYKETQAGWDESFDKMKAKLAEESERLKHPKPPVFAPLSEEPEAKHAKKSYYTDSLVRVGNFLGSSTSTIERIGHTHTQLLRSIEKNTRAAASKNNHSSAHHETLAFPHH